jgi:hypothetical protein
MRRHDDSGAGRFRLLASWFLSFPCIVAAQLAPGIIGGVIGGLSPILSTGSNSTSHQQFTVDSLRLDIRILDTLAARLGAKPTSRSPDEYCWQRRVLGRKVYDYCFIAEWPGANADTLLSDTNAWGIDTLRLRKNRMFGYYYFRAATGDAYEVSSNLAAFLNSAYHQELFPAYRRMDSLFLPVPRQTQAGLWLRGAASMGWAARYSGRDNPFMGAKRYVAELYYVLDGIMAIVGVGTAVQLVNEGSPEKIPQSLLAVKTGHTVLSWLIFTPMLSLELGETLKLRNAGYRFPATMGNPPYAY